MLNPKELAVTIAKILEDKKALDIEVLDVNKATTLADYFVICTGTSTTQIKALAQEVEFKLKTEHDTSPHHVEGYISANWILLDYGSVVVHVFHKEMREFYALERLWKDSPKISI